MNNLYYQPCSDDVFNEVKAESIKIWESYDDTYGYSTGKINGIKDLKNVQDNVMCMVAMFDPRNQAKLARNLSKKAKSEILSRFVEGGSSPYMVPFFIP